MEVPLKLSGFAPETEEFPFKMAGCFATGGICSNRLWTTALARAARSPSTSPTPVSFQWKNSDFLLKNLDFLMKNPDFLLKNADVVINQGTRFYKEAAFDEVRQY